MTIVNLAIPAYSPENGECNAPSTGRTWLYETALRTYATGRDCWIRLGHLTRWFNVRAAVIARSTISIFTFKRQ